MDVLDHIDFADLLGAWPRLAALSQAESLLGGHRRVALETWPSLRVDVRAFLEHLLSRVAAQSDPEVALRVVNAADLYLAFACLQRDHSALAELERRLDAGSVRATSWLYRSQQHSAEVRQLLRERLLVAAAGDAPKLAQYAGRGPLDAWLRTVALRVATAYRPDGANARELGEELDLEAIAGQGNFEMEYLRAEHRAGLDEAFGLALQTLDARQRTLLRLYHVERLSIDLIAPVFRVHRTTVFRWIEGSHRRVMEETRRRLGESLCLTASETSSLMRLMTSQLDASLSRLLEPDEAGDVAASGAGGLRTPQRRST